MSEHTINLRSDNPALLVEFNLPPGTHARIGAAIDAEVSIPLAGLAAYAGLIGRTPEGRLYLSDADGGNERFVALPAALPLTPYHFVVFHPEEPAAVPNTTAAPIRRKISARFQILSGVATAAAVITVSALVILNRPNKPATTNQPAQQATLPTAPQSQPEKPAPDPPVPAAPAVVVEMKAAIPEPPPAAPKFDLESLAQRIAPAVFRLEVKDADGKPAGTGTAFAISADGLAVTNFHVVEGGESFVARTTQGAEFTVSGVTATDPAADLALVTIKASNLPFLELGESAALKIGAPVAVFGSPHGLSGTLSDGILSARRDEPEIAGTPAANGGNLLQITAPISPGSSGSPVIDQTGQVIGVAVAGFTSKGSQNINFVIPIEAVKKLQKDAASGLADLRQVVRTLRPEPKEKQTPDSAFFADPDATLFQKLADAGDWIRCVKLAKQLLERHPQSSSAHFFLGYSHGAIGLSEQAETSFKRGLAISPEDADLWRCLGNVQAAQKNTLAARESWKRAGGIAPENAETWRRLSVSYLLAQEYLEAVAPMGNLRKLDRVEFERLLAVCRSLRVHPPQLQSMLIHFDDMQDGATSVAAATAPTDPEKLAAGLVAGFLRHGQGPDVQAELADYAATVNPYFDQGQQTRATILKDLTTYRAQWPSRSLQLLAVESARRDDMDTLEATYRLRYSASDGKKTRTGTLIQGIRYTLTNGRWLVSGIQTIERVVK